MTQLELATWELERCKELLDKVDRELREGTVSIKTWSEVIVEGVCISGLLAGLKALHDATT